MHGVKELILSKYWYITYEDKNDHKLPLKIVGGFKTKKAAIQAVPLIDLKRISKGYYQNGAWAVCLGKHLLEMGYTATNITEI
jgi:hypothetical protein